MNFGESLAYWYFRLNGFVPMTNFVLHEIRHDNGKKHNADADLLAVRFQHVWEKVGGQPDDWDNDRFDQWGLCHQQSTVCIICEVKTGGWTAEDVATTFRPERLYYALRRFGVLNEATAENVARQLQSDPLAKEAGYVIAKVLMADHSKGPRSSETNNPILDSCFHIDLHAAIAFIRHRMDKYRDAKSPSRMFFPGELIQFLAWESKVPMLDRGTAKGGG